MERFFPKEKIMLTGNPIRQGLADTHTTREEGIRAFGLDPAKRTVLIVGGSLGARTMNESVLKHLDSVKQSGIQFIWQTGKYYYKGILEQLNRHEQLPMLYVTDFIAKMEEAYAAADLVISRAGAGSISEFCVLKKPVILVPSPNVAEDHQTQNALALVRNGAALYVKDADAPDTLLNKAIETVADTKQLTELSKNIAKLAYTDSAEVIADEVYKLAKTYQETTY
jgi:UDP-N-acetylglucosamine--N-acetylmuramyl-(pentapeptide) pyrophosphoryl-undecaprenol N-acetylglucosamine transferase